MKCQICLKNKLKSYQLIGLGCCTLKTCVEYNRKQQAEGKCWGCKSKRSEEHTV